MAIIRTCAEKKENTGVINMNMKNKVNDVSSIAIIDALQEKYKLPPATANAMIYAIEKYQSLSIKKLATKEQLNQVRTDLEKRINDLKTDLERQINDLKTDLEKQIAVQSSQIKMLTWVMGINATATIAILTLLASQAL